MAKEFTPHEKCYIEMVKWAHKLVRDHTGFDVVGNPLFATMAEKGLQKMQKPIAKFIDKLLENQAESIDLVVASIPQAIEAELTTFATHLKKELGYEQQPESPTSLKSILG